MQNLINKKNKNILKQKIKEALKNPNKKNIGFSLKANNLKKIPYKKGYMLSLTNNSNNNLNKLISALNPLFLSLFEDIKINNLSLKKLYIGFWYDYKANLNYLDLSFYNSNKHKALKLATYFNQKAIFDLNKCNSIYLK